MWISSIFRVIAIFTAGEWFSPDLKSLVQTSLITFNFLMIFVAVQTSGLILGLLGTGGLFLYFCAVCGAMTIFIVLAVPETGGKMYSQRSEMTLNQ